MLIILSFIAFGGLTALALRKARQEEVYYESLRHNR